MGLPKLGSNMLKKESSEIEREKKEVIFKASSSRDMEKSSKESFKVNHILKNARESDSPYNHPYPPSMKSITIANRGQLTPLKSDQREKAKQELTFEQMADRRNGKTQRLNPIGL